MQSLVSAVVEPGLAGWTETLDFAKFIVKLSRTLTRLNSNEVPRLQFAQLIFQAGLAFTNFEESLLDSKNNNLMGVHCGKPL